LKVFLVKNGYRRPKSRKRRCHCQSHSRQWTKKELMEGMGEKALAFETSRWQWKGKRDAEVGGLQAKHAPRRSAGSPRDVERKKRDDQGSLVDWRKKELHYAKRHWASLAVVGKAEIRPEGSMPLREWRKEKHKTGKRTKLLVTSRRRRPEREESLKKRKAYSFRLVSEGENGR